MKENVNKVFSRFVGEGKATIRFREPAHELAISKVSIPVNSNISSMIVELWVSTDNAIILSSAGRPCQAEGATECTEANSDPATLCVASSPPTSQDGAHRKTKGKTLCEVPR